MKMQKKLVSSLLIGAVALGALSGCATKSEAAQSEAVNQTEQPVELVFWHSMGGKGGEAIDALTKQFNASQDTIQVEAQYQGAYDDAINKLKSAALGNAGPDIMQLYDIGTRWMIDSGYAVPMQGIIDQTGYDLSQLEENILAYYTIDGDLYSMPFNSSTPILYYNKDAFKEVGLDSEVAPKNFNEILDFSQKLVKKEGSQVQRYGYAMQIYGWFFEQFMVKQQLDYADNNNGRSAAATAVAFDQNGGGLAVMEGWKALVDSGVVGNFGRNGDTTKDAFISGKTAMMIGSTASLGDIKSGIDGTFELGTAYLPSVNEEDQGGVSIGGGSLWIMDKEDVKRQEAAFEFIKFMVSAEAQVAWSKATGYFPITKLAYELPEMAEHLAAHPEFNTAINQLHESTGATGAVLSVFPEARASIEENIEKMLNGEATPEEALQNSAATINKAVERYNKSNQQ